MGRRSAVLVTAVAALGAVGLPQYAGAQPASTVYRPGALTPFQQMTREIYRELVEILSLIHI
mgnify:CR=1 FL=1